METRVSQNFRRNFKPLVVTRLNDEHYETLTQDARELYYLVSSGVFIHHPQGSCRESAADPEPTAAPSLCPLAQERGGQRGCVGRTDTEGLWLGGPRAQGQWEAPPNKGKGIKHR